MARRRNQGSIWPIVMVGMGLVLILGAIGWYVMNSSNSSSAPLSTPQTADVKIPYPDVQRVSLGDAKAAYDTKMAVFVDVRGEPYYSQGHIPGALSITDVELPNRLNELNTSDWIITYCT
jgi:3-mercaptopyruvate sulfurtransferase SseA